MTSGVGLVSASVLPMLVPAGDGGRFRRSSAFGSHIRRLVRLSRSVESLGHSTSVDEPRKLRDSSDRDLGAD